jgi:EspG family
VSAPVVASASRQPARQPVVRLSSVEFDACWELLGLGDTPLTLELPSPGRTWAERHRVLTGVLTALARRGLVERSAPAAAVAGPLRLLARPDHQLDLRFSGPDGPVTCIGAVAGGRGVRLVHNGDQLRLTPIRPAELVAATIEPIGPMRAGPGRPVNIAAGVFDAARLATTDGKLWTMADELVARGVRRLDAASWVRMCSGIRSAGQLGTAVSAAGPPRFGPWAIGFQRTEAGHFLQLRRPGPDGATVTVCPVDAPRLTRLATELLAAT